MLFAVWPHDGSIHRLRVFVAKVEDMTNFNPARAHAVSFRDFRKFFRIVCFICGRIKRAAFIDVIRQITLKIDITRCLHFQESLVAKHFAFARFGEDNELMRQISANWTGVCFNRDSLETHTVKGV